MMLNLSIMPLNAEHVEEYCADIIEQQRTGVSTHAMLMMKFNPEGTPPVNKAEKQCAIYDQYRARLDRAGAKHGVLVQATLGHIVVPYEMYPFQPTVSLVTGEESVVTACPLDPDFRAYMKEQMRILAGHHPSIVMIDDDVGLLYRATKGCACRHHMAEFNRRAGTTMTREELYAHTQGDTEEDRRYTQLYVEVQRDALVDFVKCMREGLDEVDPTIQGAVSGIYVSTFLEFTDQVAPAFAGRGNPAIARMNGGPYGKYSHRYFTDNMFRAAILKENTKHKVDMYLAETDTCPQNRYSTSAALLHAHFTAAIFEGAVGAKHWITRTVAYEPASGKAYRKTLSQYHKFYEAVSAYVKDLTPFGCRIPLTRMQDYGFVRKQSNQSLSPWSTCVLERLGLPLYFSNEEGGAVFLDDYSARGFSDEVIAGYLQGTLILSAMAADTLVKRGFGEDIGVTVSPWKGATITREIVHGVGIAAQYNVKQLIPVQDGVEALSQVIHLDAKTGESQNLFPGVTRFANRRGGETIVFSGTPDMPFNYATAFSLLNETRKKQLASILTRRGHVPVYYPADGEVYLRAGVLPGGVILAAVFNLGFDMLEEIPLCCQGHVRSVEMLSAEGTRETAAFEERDGVVYIRQTLAPMTPAVVFLTFA